MKYRHPQHHTWLLSSPHKLLPYNQLANQRKSGSHDHLRLLRAVVLTIRIDRPASATTISTGVPIADDASHGVSGQSSTNHVHSRRETDTAASDCSITDAITDTLLRASGPTDRRPYCSLFHIWTIAFIFDRHRSWCFSIAAGLRTSQSTHNSYYRATPWSHGLFFSRLRRSSHGSTYPGSWCIFMAIHCR